MSYIFEALQRAEAERSGGSLPKNIDSVVDLLQGQGQEQGQEAESDSARAPLQDEWVGGELATRADPPLDVAEVAQQQSSHQQSAERQSAQRQSIPEFAAADKPNHDRAAVTTFADARVISPRLKLDPRLVCMTDQGGLAAEKFRVLGLKLRHLRERRKLKRIVVTGTAPEEGKSLIAANLALNQSRSKVLKTILIDGDLRRPTVASRLGCDRSLPGLSECLRGEQELADVVYKLKGSGLWFLPAGSAPENPLELMQGGRLPQLLDRLGEFFDWIIIDTPPVVPVADTTFWMKLADGVLIVIREGVSEKKVVERALDSFDRATLLGVVVNSCSRSDHNSYYSRYGQAVGAGEASGSQENTNE
jgi:capsular exopolysaccharide synthesis family protein